MTEEELYDYLQSFLSPDLQFINPYITKAPLPDEWCQMTTINIMDKGRSQERQAGVDEENKNVLIAYDQTRIYTIQFDFYGPNAFNNCKTCKQTLQIALDRLSHIGQSIIGFKSATNIENLSFLMTDKRFKNRYKFDLDLFMVDTITISRPYLTGADIKILPYSY